MSTLAKVVPIPKGNYSASATYNSLDIVRYDGKSWMCKQDSITNITPTEGAYWMMIVQDGGGATSLSSLSDVTVSSPSNGQILLYNSTSGKWENGTTSIPTASSSTLGVIKIGKGVSIDTNDKLNLQKDIIFGHELSFPDTGIISSTSTAGTIVHILPFSKIICLTNGSGLVSADYSFNHNYSVAQQEFLLGSFIVGMESTYLEINISKILALDTITRTDDGTDVYYTIVGSVAFMVKSDGSYSYADIAAKIRFMFYRSTWNIQE